MNPRRIVIARVISNYVVVPTRNIDAGCIMVTRIIRNRRPGAGQPDALTVIMTIVVYNRRLSGILNADTRMGRTSRALAARHAHFVVVSRISIANQQNAIQSTVLDNHLVHIDPRCGWGIDAVDASPVAIQRAA